MISGPTGVTNVHNIGLYVYNTFLFKKEQFFVYYLFCSVYFFLIYLHIRPHTLNDIGLQHIHISKQKQAV